MKKPTTLELGKLAAKIADDKKGRDIVLLNVKRVTPIADYFLIVTADSNPQMRAIIDSIEQEFRERGLQNPVHRDGQTSSSSWAVLDYGGIIIHVMMPAAREFYALEKIWSEARKVKVE